MKRLALVFCVALALFALVQAALAGKPTREFVPFESDVISGFCSFDVLVDSVQTSTYVMTFTDKNGQVVKIIASGVFKVRLTNASTGTSAVVNISGPEQVRIDDDGVTDVAVGPWIIGFPEENKLLLTKGRLVFGEGSESLGGTSTDLCTLLA
jgi:hypothetical protein